MKVSITKEKLDVLANTVSAKTDESIPLTIDEMADAVGHMVVPSGTISISANATGIDVSQYASADVAVSGGNDFVVTVSWNSSTNLYEPDKTFSQISEAYSAGKTIAVRMSVPSEEATADGEFNGAKLAYTVHVYDGGIDEFLYELTASGIVTLDTARYILPSGTINISQSGNTDVTNYATANVPAGALGNINVPLPQTNDFYIGINSSTGVVTAEVDTIASVTPVSQAGYLDTSASTQAFAYGTKTLQLTTQAAQTIHPSSSDQTIASGRYLTGAQTVKAVTTTNLSASNILSGVTIKVGDSTDDDCVASVTGNVAFQTYYTGSSAPSSSLGNNGDIYLQS